MRTRISSVVRIQREAARRQKARTRKNVHTRPVLTLVPQLPEKEHRHSFRKPAAKYALADNVRRCSCGATRTLEVAA